MKNGDVRLRYNLQAQGTKDLEKLIQNQCDQGYKLKKITKRYIYFQKTREIFPERYHKVLSIPVGSRKDVINKCAENGFLLEYKKGCLAVFTSKNTYQKLPAGLENTDWREALKNRKTEKKAVLCSAVPTVMLAAAVFTFIVSCFLETPDERGFIYTAFCVASTLLFFAFILGGIPLGVFGILYSGKAFAGKTRKRVMIPCIAFSIISICMALAGLVFTVGIITTVHV